jgi:biotin synthase
MDFLKKFDDAASITRDDLIEILKIDEPAVLEQLFKAAYEVKKRYVGTTVHLRGIVEIGNICSKNCYYCGIRGGNRKVERFMLSREEIIESAMTAYSFNYGSAVLQGGEISNPDFVDMIESILLELKERTGGKLGITLSLGEQRRETYERWFSAGAHRYLLRIESSNPELYRKLHPVDHSYDKRLECLHMLKEAGYQTGTGVMIGLPYQTLSDLAGDILFFRDFDIDMIGMGPYLVHPDTPLAAEVPDFEQIRDTQLSLGLKMIAVARLLLKDVNIASTTALQALDAHGRERGLLAGGNVIMPNVTATKYRKSYLLYEGKPGIDENSEQSRHNLEMSIAKTGETIEYDSWGDSPHFYARNATS